MIGLTVLGSAASLPTKRRVPACYAVRYGGVYLFDACEGVQRQMMKYGVSYAKTDAVFLTHLHADHWLGLLGLTQTMNMSGRQRELKVFGPRGTKNFFETLFATRELRTSFPVTVKDVRKSRVFECELFSVEAFPVEHGCPAVGYTLQEPEKTRFHEEKAKSLGVKGRLFSELSEKKELKINGKKVRLKDVTYRQPGRKIVFSGDTAPCKELTGAAKKADLLVMDSCFSEKEAGMAKEKKHSTALQAAKTAKKAGAQKLLLTHFSNRYEDREPLLEEAKTVFEESSLAREGLELTI
jgi:ribonuclease Z